MLPTMRRWRVGQFDARSVRSKTARTGGEAGGSSRRGAERGGREESARARRGRRLLALLALVVASGGLDGRALAGWKLKYARGIVDPHRERHDSILPPGGGVVDLDMDTAYGFYVTADGKAFDHTIGASMDAGGWVWSFSEEVWLS